MTWAIYENPADYPGKFVVRGWQALGNGEMNPASAPAAVVDIGKGKWLRLFALVEARRAVPKGMIRIDRADGDDPQIVETWI